MGTPVEQLNSDYTLSIEEDRPIKSNKAIYDLFSSYLPDGELSYGMRDSCKYIQYEIPGKTILILYANITYLGNPWDINLKRIQIKPAWKSFVETNPGIDIRYIGIYQHKGLSLFVDFIKESYLQRKGNNSAAHVHTADLFLGLRRGYFSRVDKNGNELRVIRSDRLQDYLFGVDIEPRDLLNLPKQFEQFIIANNLKNYGNVIDCFGTFIKDCYEGEIDIIDSNERKFGIDFNIKFSKEDFYGILLETKPGRWKISQNAIKQIPYLVKTHGKVWLIVVEVNGDYSHTLYHIEFNPVNINHIKISGELLTKISLNEESDYFIIPQEVDNFILYRSLFEGRR